MQRLSSTIANIKLAQLHACNGLRGRYVCTYKWHSFREHHTPNPNASNLLSFPGDSIKLPVMVHGVDLIRH